MNKMLDFEILEPRLAMAISVLPSGDIEVVGTPGDDSIQFIRVNASTVRVIINSTVQNVNAPGRLIAYGGGGNDVILNKNVARPASFYGGDGNDTLTGGSGDDRLYGGAGNDLIFGSAGNDLIAGNIGNDQLYGDNGKDVIIGGDGSDLMRSGQGNDAGFTDIVGLLAPIVGTDESLTYLDVNDLAMLALLNDQADDAALNTVQWVHTRDGDTDDTSDFQ